MAVKVNVQGLLRSLQNEMTIGATIQVAGNHRCHARRKAPLKILANEADRFSARHGDPQIYWTLRVPRHDMLQPGSAARLEVDPLESFIYELVTSTLTVTAAVSSRNFFPEPIISA